MEDLVPLMGWLCRRRDRAAGRGSGSLAATGPESCDERLDDLVLTIVDDLRDDTRSQRTLAMRRDGLRADFN
jgi:hypothetical protein